MHARAIVTEAEEKAALMVTDAERERAALTERAEHLRRAISTLQASAAQLAALANAQASVIDLSEVESLERAELDLSDVDLRAIERAEEHLQSLEALDRAHASDEDDVAGMQPEDAREDTADDAGAGDVAPEIAADGGPLPEPRRLLTVAEAADEIARADSAGESASADTTEEGDAGDTEDPPERPTYYQRSTGIPLSERVKLARRSG